MSQFYPAASYSEIMAEEGEFRAVAVMRHLPPGDCSHMERMMWGAGGKCPETAIAKMFVECSGERVRVSRSAYSDLSNVDSIQVRRDDEKGRHMVTIRGGKSDAAYIVRMETISYDGWFEEKDHGFFSASMVRSREVSKAAAPDEVEERTKYTYGEITSIRDGCHP